MTDEEPQEEPEFDEPTAPEPLTEDLAEHRWPRPEVYARPATDAETPTAARGFAKLARDNGWAVRVTYSRGTVPVARNRWIPGKVVDACVVRCQRGGMGVVASWEDGKTKTAWILIPGVGPVSLGVLAARDFLKGKPA